jgi:two-component system sensor histidine kinase QseC
MAAATLTRHLLAWVLGALVAVWATFIAVGWRTGQHEADELTDGHLASVAALVGGSSLAGFVGGPAPRAPAGNTELKAHDYQQSLSVLVWDAAGRLVGRSGDAPVPAALPQEGFSTLELGTPLRAWRVFARRDEARRHLVMVALAVDERDDLADDIAGQVIAPGLWLLPVIALVLGLAIQRGLRPLHRLARDVEALDVRRPQPIPSPAPHAELQAVAEAINALVARAHAALTRERALAGEFAHELRTPLASLLLQARALRSGAGAGAGAGAGDDDAALRRLEADVLRAGDVLSHLLALARADRAELAEAAQPLDLQALAASVVAEAAPAAVAGGREIALVDRGAIPIQGHAVLLELALRNLVENALSHTPVGSLVEVEAEAGGRWVQVCDMPPGEAVAPGAGNGGGPALGLGLGHRVVERVAALHGGRLVELPPSAGEGRRCYRVELPPAEVPRPLRVAP